MRINIMTSCDETIARFLVVQFASIQMNLQKYDVHFYLFHNRIQSASIDFIKNFANKCSCITFHEVIVNDIQPYEKMADIGGSWPYEAYFSLCAQNYLPNEMERILYIDAADVVIHDDILDFYASPFEDKLIIAATAWYKKTEDGKLEEFLPQDLNDPIYAKKITKGITNSGAFVLNLEKLREENISINDYVTIAENIKNTYPHFEPTYFGDQGLISAIFLGKIRYFEGQEFSTHPYVQVCSKYHIYSELLVSFPETPYMKAAILHFGGPVFKPWQAWITPDVVKQYGYLFSDKYKNVNKYAPFTMNWQQCQMNEIWWYYCQQTPIFQESAMYARIAGMTLEHYYLPLCKKYNDLVDGKCE